MHTSCLVLNCKCKENIEITSFKSGWLCPKCERVWSNGVPGCLSCNKIIDEYENKNKILCSLCNKDCNIIISYENENNDKYFCSKKCIDKYFGNKI